MPATRLVELRASILERMQKARGGSLATGADPSRAALHVEAAPLPRAAREESEGDARFDGPEPGQKNPRGAGSGRARGGYATIAAIQMD